MAKSARSSLNEADEQTSFVEDVDVELDVAVLFWSRGVHVANSHFSKRHDNNGNNGWLQKIQKLLLLYFIWRIWKKKIF